MFSCAALAAVREVFHDITLEEPSRLDLQQTAPRVYRSFSHYPGRPGLPRPRQTWAVWPSLEGERW